MNNHKSELLMQALTDQLSCTALEPATLDERKSASLARINSHFSALCCTSARYAVQGTIERLMSKYATVTVDTNSSLVRAIEKSCKSDNYYRSTLTKTVFKFSDNFVTFHNHAGSDDILTVQISRYVP